MSAVSVIIPNWNGAELLRRFLPSVIAEACRWAATQGQPCEVLVSDDGSNDSSLELLRVEFPSVRIEASAVNRGFGPAVNAGVAAAIGDIIILLNSDLEVVPGAFEPLTAWFDDPRLFGVTMRGLDLPDLRFSTGGKLGRFRRGFWETWRNYDAALPPHTAADALALPTFALVGGFCAFRRAVFLELGGFDARLAPYYWEDIDLSYRARKRGWRLGFEPRAVVHHAVSASVARHAGRFERESVIQRNRLLFHWKNLGGARLVQHLLWAHLLLLQFAFKGDFAYHAGYCKALRHVDAVRRFRRSERSYWRLSDAQLELPTAPDGLRD